MRNIRPAAFALLAVALFAHSAAAEPLLWKPITNSLPARERSGLQGLEHFSDREERSALSWFNWRIAFCWSTPSARQVFELTPDKIKRSGSDVLWDPADIPSRPMVTSDWLVRDVGLAYRIKVHLDAEDRTLDLQLTHPVGRP